jgi:hypothetical protein
MKATDPAPSYLIQACARLATGPYLWNEMHLRVFNTSRLASRLTVTHNPESQLLWSAERSCNHCSGDGHASLWRAKVHGSVRLEGGLSGRD